MSRNPHKGLTKIEMARPPLPEGLNETAVVFLAIALALIGAAGLAEVVLGAVSFMEISAQQIVFGSIEILIGVILLCTMIGGAVGLGKKSRKWLMCFLVFSSCSLICLFFAAINATVVYAGSGSGSWAFLAPVIISWISVICMIVAIALSAIVRNDIQALKKVRDRHPAYGMYGQEDNEKLAPGEL